MEKNFIIAGFGGQGVLLAGTILANSFMLAGKNVTWYPCYGAEMRGGTVNCEIVVADSEVSSVHKQDADYALVLNQQSFDKFVQRLKSGGTIIANSTLVAETKPRFDVNYVLGQKLVDKRQQTVVVDYRSQVNNDDMEYERLSYTQSSFVF